MFDQLQIYPKQTVEISNKVILSSSFAVFSGNEENKIRSKVEYLTIIKNQI